MGMPGILEILILFAIAAVVTVAVIASIKLFK